MMIDPIAKAKWVLETMGITGIPAESLQTIAENTSLKFSVCDFPDDPWLDGMLLFKNDVPKAIVVNTHRGKTGKHNFTFAHELGHYFLSHPPSFHRDGQSGIRCTSTDINNEREQKPREVEANRFAANLLMPEDRFRLDMAGAPLDFALITGLANRYLVSKQACSNRILALIQSSCIIVLTEGLIITGTSYSRSARGFLKPMTEVPSVTAAYGAVEQKWGRDSFTECKADIWLSRAIPGNKLYECTHCHLESGTAMTILKW